MSFAEGIKMINAISDSPKSGRSDSVFDRCLTRVVNLRCATPDVHVDRTSILGNPFDLPNKGNLKARAACVDAHKKYLWMIMQGDEPENARRVVSAQSKQPLSRAWRSSTHKEFMIELRSLKGKSIGCWCAPARCHADNLAAAVEWLDKQ